MQNQSEDIVGSLNPKTMQKDIVIKTQERCKKDSHIDNFRDAENAEQYNQRHHCRKHGRKRTGINRIDAEIYPAHQGDEFCPKSIAAVFFPGDHPAGDYRKDDQFLCQNAPFQ